MANDFWDALTWPDGSNAMLQSRKAIQRRHVLHGAAIPCNIRQANLPFRGRRLAGQAASHDAVATDK